MEHILHFFIELLETEQSLLGLLILFASAALEYIFPPFPGDTITLFGAFLSAVAGWSVPLVFIVVTLGSMCGAALDYALGFHLARTPVEKLSDRKLKVRQKLEPVLASFRKYGAVYLGINRFFPGIRALFFVAAGMAKLPIGKVLLWGGLSAAAWNTLIITAGFLIGKNWEQLAHLLQTYTIIAWIIVGITAFLLIFRWSVKSRNHNS